MTGTTTVWLLRNPVELGLMGLGRDGGTSTHDVPVRRQEMVDVLTRRYGSELSEPDRLGAAAAARGQATVDLACTTSYGAVSEAAVRGWRTMLAEVDEYCGAEDLLTLRRTPEQVRLQDWVCEQFLRQLHGDPPEPWTPRPVVAAVPADG